MGESEEVEQRAMWAATLAARQVIAQSKNPVTLMGRYPPTTVAYHAAAAAIEAHQRVYAKAFEAIFPADPLPAGRETWDIDRLWGTDAE